MQTPIRSGFDTLITAMNAVGTVWIVGLMILIDADVGGRAIANLPIQGTEEIVSFSIVGIFFLQLAHTLKSGRMTRNTIIPDFLATRAPQALAAVEAAFNLTGTAVFAALTWAIWPAFWHSVETGDYYGTLCVFTFPVWPINALILLGGAATSVQYLLLTFDEVRANRRSGSADTSSKAPDGTAYE